MWIFANPNPAKKNVPDCVIRAVCIALNIPWMKVKHDLNKLSDEEFSVTCDDHVWGKYLYRLGFRPVLLPKGCPQCITIRMFSQIFPKGTYIIGTGYHAVAVIDGNYYDTWDSGDEVPSFFWKID